MTYREKLKIEHPEKVVSWAEGGSCGCPAEYGYGSEDIYGMCPLNMTCEDCWDQEYIEKTENNKNKGEEIMNNTTTKKTKTKAELLDEITNLKNEIERLDRYKNYENAANETFAIFKAYVNAGFTSEQAFAIVNTMVSNIKLN